MPEDELVLPDSDLQADALAGFRKDHAVYLFLTVADVDLARASLLKVLPRITPLGDVAAFNDAFRRAVSRRGEPAKAMTAIWVNVGFSASGVAALVSQEDREAFGDGAFKVGMREQSTYLGDPGDPSALGHVSQWVFGGDKPVDAVVIAAADDPVVLAQTSTAIVELLTTDAGGWDVVHVQPCAVRTDLPGHEHFGFRDGISQPAPRGRLTSGALLSPRYLADPDPRASTFARPGSPLVWPGEFVVGLPRQSPDDVTKSAAPRTPSPAWTANGSFLVIRRLSQDVAAFRAFCAATADLLSKDATAPGAPAGLTAERFAALLVGRWPSGAPLCRSPESDNAVLGADDFAANSYGYRNPWGIDAAGPPELVTDLPLPRGVAQNDSFKPPQADEGGVLCPIAAHVRKVNPRDQDSNLGGPIDTLRRHILRRGLPFGPPYDSDPTQERGLLFACYQSSIVDQFLKITNNWVNQKLNPVATPPGYDLLIGQGTDKFATLSDADGRLTTVHADPHWVIPTGGEYFFAPSISAIRTTFCKAASSHEFSSPARPCTASG